MRTPVRVLALASLLAGASACAGGEAESIGPERTGPDASISDSGTGGGGSDAGIRDIGGGSDVADPDAGLRDTPEPDTTVDVGGPDLADVPPSDADAGDPDVDPTDAGGEDSGEPDVGDPDVGDPDAEPDVVEPECDEDGDGSLSVECGGDDCDDTNPSISPRSREACDFIDNDCVDGVNNGIDCRVYAHTSSTLYRIDPFLGTEESVGSVPGLFDFDTNIDGDLYGISPSALFRFDEGAGSWTRIGSLGRTANGFAIDSTGRAFATSGNNVYSVDLATGGSSLIGSMGGAYNSSGDCVVDKDDSLFMTSNHTPTDELVFIDGATGVARSVGNTGYPDIYGLTAAWGFLFGFDASGNVIQIDSSTGVGRVVANFPGRVWYGAASSPIR